MNSQNQKSKELLPKIIQASNNTEAIEVLHNILELLHLSESYVNLVKVRDALAEQKAEYNKITDNYQNSDKSLKQMLDTRTELNFVYRNISDQFSYVVNKNKIWFEEEKTSVRAKAMENLKNSKEAQDIFKTTSTSGLRDIVGFDNLYQEYISNAAISYGLWQELNNVLNSIRMFTDLLASSIKTEQMVQIKDVK